MDDRAYHWRNRLGDAHQIGVGLNHARSMRTLINRSIKTYNAEWRMPGRDPAGVVMP
jgi:hypothetical protein